MIKKYILSVGLTILAGLMAFNNTIYSQTLLHCGADELRIETLKENPTIASAVVKREEALEAYTQHYTPSLGVKIENQPYIIPVVFHVIHNNGIENIGDAQLKDAIRVLNQTFQKRAPDTNSIVAAFKPIHADCEIEFRIAKKDPQGYCTKGINRIVSTLTNTGDHSVKDLIQWPTHKYLNVYIVKNAAGLAGHAVWPSDADTIPAWDGIVMGHNYTGSIGTSNLQRSVVFAHECGHYLNLHHIWGGNNVPGFYFLPCADPNKDCTEDDFVEDTPPTIGWVTCNLNGSTCDTTLDNVQNAMDYSYCNKMFTYGQKDRMHACLNSTIAGRNNLHTTENLMATGVLDTANVDCDPLSLNEANSMFSYTIFPNPVRDNFYILSPSLSLKNTTVRVFSVFGQEVNIIQLNIGEYKVDQLKNGVYILMLIDEFGNFWKQKFMVCKDF